MSSLMLGPMLTVPSEQVMDRLVWMTQENRGKEPVEVETHHLLHGGMYARTICIPNGHVVIGSRMRVPTVLMVHGVVDVLNGDTWMELTGPIILPGSAGRKQAFAARKGDVILTMVMPTQAKTVEEAEVEMTDEAAGLLSRRQAANRTLRTGE